MTLSHALLCISEMVDCWLLLLEPVFSHLDLLSMARNVCVCLCVYSLLIADSLSMSLDAHKYKNKKDNLIEQL